MTKRRENVILHSFQTFSPAVQFNIMIKCNLCWKKFEPQEISFITSCCHIFCMLYLCEYSLLTLLQVMTAPISNFQKNGYAPAVIKVFHRGRLLLFSIICVLIVCRGGISRNVLAVTPDKTVCKFSRRPHYV